MISLFNFSRIFRTSILNSHSVKNLINLRKFSQDGKAINNLTAAVCEDASVTKELIQEALNYSKERDNFSFTAPKETKSALANEIWALLKELGTPLEINHYNALLEIYLENNYEFSPVAFLKIMKNSGASPNGITFQHLMQRCCMDGKSEEAKYLLEYMKKNELPIDGDIFNLLLLCHAKQRNLEGCLCVVSAMRENKFNLNNTSYLMLAKCYIENEKMDLLDKLLDECSSKDIFEISDISDLLSTLMKNGKEDFVPKALQTVKQYDRNNAMWKCISHMIDEADYEAAYKIAFQGTINKEENASLFLTSLAKHKAPFDTVVNYCKKLLEDGYKPLISTAPLRVYLENDHLSACKFLSIMKDLSCNIRPHYFYPLFCTEDYNVISRNLDSIYGASLSIPLYVWSKYILPNLESFCDPCKGYGRFSEKFHPFSTVDYFNACLMYSTRRNDLGSAVSLVRTFPRRIYFTLSHLLPHCYIATENATDIIYLLQRIDRTNITYKDDDGLFSSTPKLFKTFLEDTINLIPDDGFERKLQPLLQEMLNGFLFMSKEHVDDILKLIGPRLTPNIEECLAHLVQNSVREKQRLSWKKMKVVSDLLRVCKSNNIKKAERYLEMAELNGIEVSTNIIIKLLSLCLKEGNLERAEKYMNSLLNAKYQKFRLPILKYATLLVENNRIEDAAKALLDHSPSDNNWQKEKNKQDIINLVITPSRNLLYKVLEKGTVSDFNSIRNNLLSEGYCSARHLSLADAYFPLKKGDFDNALKLYIEAITENNMDYDSIRMIRECLKRHDKFSLEKIEVAVSGCPIKRTKIKHMLAICYLEEDNVLAAEQVSKDFQYNVNLKLLQHFCSEYLEHHQVGKVKNVIQFFKNITVCHSLFCTLLNYYVNKNDVDGASDFYLWLQEENEHVSNEFLINLANLLERNGREVNFVVPQTLKDFQNIDIPEFIRHVGLLIYKDDYDAVVKEGKKFFSSSRFHLEGDDFIILMKYLSTKNDVDTFNWFESRLHKPSRKLGLVIESFYLENCAFDEYINFLRRMLNLKEKLRYFPLYDRLASVIFENPDLEPKFVELGSRHAKYYAAKLWCAVCDYNLSIGNIDRANEIYETYLGNYKLRLDFVFLRARETNDDSIVKTLLKFSRNKYQHPVLIGKAYSCYIEILEKQGRYQDCIDAIEESLKSISLSDYTPDVLISCKTLCEEAGCEFPFKIPRLFRDAKRQNLE